MQSLPGANQVSGAFARLLVLLPTEDTDVQCTLTATAMNPDGSRASATHELEASASSLSAFVVFHDCHLALMRSSGAHLMLEYILTRQVPLAAIVSSSADDEAMRVYLDVVYDVFFDGHAVHLQCLLARMCRILLLGPLAMQ